MEAISVIFFSDPEFSRLIEGKFQISNSFKRLIACSSLHEFEAVYERDNNCIAVIDETFVCNELSSVMDFAHKNKIKYVSICKHKTEMFAILNSGAGSTIIKPAAHELDDFCSDLFFKLRSVQNRVEPETERVLKNDFGSSFKKIIAIGSSTGGTEAVFEVLQRLPANIPPILVVQHMPEIFTKIYAEKLNNECKMSVWEAKDGDELRPGLCLIAPGKRQMSLARTPKGLAVKVKEDTENRIYVPSVDVLFLSIAELAAGMTVGIILTGMGKDGAKGLLSLKEGGAFCIGQDKESSVVYGMPKAAFEIGAVERQAHINDIASIVLSHV